MPVDGLEGFRETLPGNFVDVLDGFFSITDGVDQVLPLRAQEILALLALLILFERLRVDRPEPFDTRPPSVPT